LLIRVPGYISGGPGFDSRALQEKKVVALEQGPLSLMRTTEELGLELATFRLVA
jgi:hypothetical protein